MVFDPMNSDEAILIEMGRRLAQRRLSLGHTQAELAEKAGLAKRTVERIEAGNPTHTTNLIRMLRGLGWVENLDALVPDPGPSPMDLLKLKARQRQRAPRKDARANQPWTWGEER